MTYRNLKTKKEINNYLESVKERVIILSHVWNDDTKELKLREKYADLWFEYIRVYYKVMMLKFKTK